MAANDSTTAWASIAFSAYRAPQGVCTALCTAADEEAASHAVALFKAWEAELLWKAAFGGRPQEAKKAAPAADATQLL